MDLAPDTTTIEAQRGTELLLLDYLRRTNPHVYALWHEHPDYEADGDEDSDDADGNFTEAATAVQAGHCAASSNSSQTADGGYNEARLFRELHEAYASTRLANLPSALQGMYASRPWLAYWSLQAADLLGVVESELLTRTSAEDIVTFLHSCLCVDAACAAELAAANANPPSNSVIKKEELNSRSYGSFSPLRLHGPVMGFAGGPSHQAPHLASSYAACCALVILSRYDDGECLRRLPRAALKRWLLALRNSDGSFRVHGGGESDIRASYCAAVLTMLLGLDDPSSFDENAAGGRVEGSGVEGEDAYADDVRWAPVLTLETARFVVSCQTHEGGFTCSATASEAHGAYTQCGLAALLLMKQPHLVHQASLRRWLAARQLACEGGFNGRTNKLVDSCYSHWIGASHVLLRAVEAYAKCFTTAVVAMDAAGPDHDGTLSSSACLRAREVLLLDHVQLLDVTGIQTNEVAAWDAAEEAEFVRHDLADAFLSADDATLRAAVTKRVSSSALYDNLLRTQYTEEGKEEKEEELRTFHVRQAFLFAEVGDYYFNQRKLQDYVLRCCQDKKIGGLMDKPGTAHDAYHTCYSLSGMSGAQNLPYLTHARAAATNSRAAGDPSSYLSRAFVRSYLPTRSSEEPFGVVLSMPGPSTEAERVLLRPMNPIFNVSQSAVRAALRTWSMMSFI